MKPDRIKRFFKSSDYLWAAFFFPVVLLSVVYAAFGVYPAGEQSMLVLDMNAQYVYFYEGFRDAFLGQGSLLYSFSRNLGGEMLGTLGYYLASPYNFITLLFPKAMMTEALLVITLAKAGSCGAAAAYYLRKSKNIKKWNAVLFALLYACGSYFVVQCMNLMWFDAVIVLPLMMLGIEQLILKRKFALYTLSLAFGIITNFYMGFMLCIFSVIYFVYYFCCFVKTSEFKHNRACLIRYAVFSLLAAGISAAMIFSVYYSLGLGKFEFSNPDFSYQSQFALMDVFVKLLPISFDTVRPEGLPFIYSGLLVLLLLPVYFSNPEIELSKKAGAASLLSILVLCFNIKPVDMVWHGLQVPNWLPYRYSFIFSFLLIVFAAEAFDKIRHVKITQLAKVYAGLAVLIIIVDKFNYSFIKRQEAILFSIICLAFYLIAIYIYNLPGSINMPVVVIMICCIELFLNDISMMAALNKDVVYSGRKTYTNFMEETRPMTDMLKERDAGFYRIEKTFHRTVNDSFALGTYGLSHSNSTLNSKTTEVLKKLGFGSRDHWTKYAGATEFTDMLLGVKYIMTKDSMRKSYENILEIDNIRAYENANALPIAFLANERILDVPMGGDNPFEFQNALMAALLGEDSSAMFVRQRHHDTETENVTKSGTVDHTVYTVQNSGQTATVEFLLDGIEDKKLYAYFPSTYQRKADVLLDGDYYDRYYDGSSAFIVDFGYFEQDEEISIGMKLSEDNIYLKDEQFYYFDEDIFNAGADMLRAYNQSTFVTMRSQSRIIVEVEAGESMVLMTSIPYEKGWSVKIDGKKAETIKVADSLLAVGLTAGAHKIELSFMPFELKLGLVVSALSLVLFVALWLMVRKKAPKAVKIKNTVIKEGLSQTVLIESFDEQKLGEEGGDDVVLDEQEPQEAEGFVWSMPQDNED